jgi:hypothetical protein
MEKVDLATVIQEAISRVSQNRIGAKPLVFVTLAPAMTHVPWRNRTAAIEVSLRRRALLNDLDAFVGIKPSYWIQLRVSGRGIRVAEKLIEELFSEIGLLAEEWIGITGSGTRLGIFGAIDAPKIKMVFCIESLRHKQKCDLLLPIIDARPGDALVDGVSSNHPAQL